MANVKMDEGSLFIYEERVFRVEELLYDEEGWLFGVAASCLTPQTDDESQPWEFTVKPGESLAIQTVH